MSTFTLKLKRMSLTSRILLSTIGVWFTGTTLVLLWLRMNWQPFLNWLIG